MNSGLRPPAANRTLAGAFSTLPSSKVSMACLQQTWRHQSSRRTRTRASRTSSAASTQLAAKIDSYPEYAQSCRGHGRPEGAGQDPGRACGRRPLHRGRPGRWHLDENAALAGLLTPDARAPSSRDLSEDLKAARARPESKTTEQAVRAFAERKGHQARQLSRELLRAALTESITSPPIFDVLAVLGEERKPWPAARFFKPTPP